MMNKSDADTADIAIIIDHLIHKGDSKHFSLKRLFTRIRGYAIIKPIISIRNISAVLSKKPLDALQTSTVNRPVDPNYHLTKLTISK